MICPLEFRDKSIFRIAEKPSHFGDVQDVFPVTGNLFRYGKPLALAGGGG